MSKSNVMERLNRHIINKGSKHIDLSGHYDTVTDDASIALMAVKQISAFVRDKITYFTSLEVCLFVCLFVCIASICFCF